ncbi:hypothetical protein M422DRAFT_273149, partial [Sphaerobolus stellatus SS14]
MQPPPEFEDASSEEEPTKDPKGSVARKIIEKIKLTSSFKVAEAKKEGLTGYNKGPAKKVIKLKRKGEEIEKCEEDHEQFLKTISAVVLWPCGLDRNGDVITDTAYPTAQSLPDFRSFDLAVRDPPKIDTRWEYPRENEWLENLFPVVWPYVRKSQEASRDPFDFDEVDNKPLPPWVVLTKKTCGMKLTALKAVLVDGKDLLDVAS